LAGGGRDAMIEGKFTGLIFFINGVLLKFFSGGNIANI